ncbi:MAG TPA: PQQ-binding-like beta-propeller repeat protein [Methylomirabilota bacterium]|nr:PQQ-binding-like beta-propeller repeat protein [Methylomirabilota bacterium]
MKSTFAIGTVVMCAALTLPAGDWPQWRGVNRDGHTGAGATPVSSLPKELKPVWKIAIGPGFSSPIAAGGKVIYLDEQNGKEVAHCVEANAAREIWSAPFADAFGDEWGSGPRSTPFVNGERVYVQSMGGEFHCLDFATGKPLWNVPFKKYGVPFSTKAAEGTASRRGNNGSGIAEGDYVYVPVGAKGASVVCFEKLTGKEVWKTGDDQAAYSSFLIATLAGTKQLVAFTADALTGLDLKTGSILWRTPFKTNAKRHAASPVLIGDDTLTVNSHTFGLIATKVSKEGDTFKTTERWANKEARINLGTPTFVNGFLYSQGGVNTKTLICVDATSGQTKWAEPGFGKDVKDYSSVIAVGKNLLVLTYDGQLLLLEANPEKYTELGRVQACGSTWSHPAFADGKLYVRDARELQCFDLSTKSVAAR